jgi:hypothetical protein
MSVFTQPGQTEFTAMRSAASSSANARLRPLRAVLGEL